MPEMTFTVVWPDGEEAECYSPSLVMHDHLTAGQHYTVAEFVALSGRALDIASDRVRERFGYVCTSAIAQKSEIETVSLRYAAEDFVLVSRMEPGLS